MPTLAREFNISLSTVHGYIEEQRKLLRKSAQKRKSSKSPVSAFTRLFYAVDPFSRNHGGMYNRFEPASRSTLGLQRDSEEVGPSLRPRRAALSESIGLARPSWLHRQGPRNMAFDFRRETNAV